jgi:hypothetical protein
LWYVTEASKEGMKQEIFLSRKLLENSKLRLTYKQISGKFFLWLKDAQGVLPSLELLDKFKLLLGWVHLQLQSSR